VFRGEKFCETGAGMRKVEKVVVWEKLSLPTAHDSGNGTLQKFSETELTTHIVHI